MNRENLTAYLADTYSADCEHLFAKYPSFLVDMSYELTK